jgi:hypothetical protein
MIRVTTDERTSYVALTADVAYRIEIGYAVVDDGHRLFRFLAPAFERIVSVASEPAEDEALEAIVRAHPTVFCLVPTTAAAAESFADREI